MLTHLDALSPINLADPLNTQHPLNHGRIAWWLTVPEVAGGQYWYDLTGLYPGTLTSMGNGTSGWRNPTRQGSAGQMLFNGSCAVNVSSGIFKKLSNKIVSFACWFNPGGSLSSYQALFDTGTASTLRQLTAYLGGSASQLFVAIAGVGGGAVSLSTSWQLNTWQRMLVTCDGTTVTIYANGRAVGSGTSSLLGSAFVTSALAFGSDASGGGAANFVGSMDDVAVWNRALSAAEACEDYNLGRLGYPGLLNRVPSQRMVSLPASSPVGYAQSGLPLSARNLSIGI